MTRTCSKLHRATYPVTLGDNSLAAANKKNQLNDTAGMASQIANHFVKFCFVSLN